MADTPPTDTGQHHSDLDKLLRPSRSAGERQLGIIRFVFVLLSIAAVVGWFVLHPADRPPRLPWMAMVQGVYLVAAAAFLVWSARHAVSSRLGYLIAAADVLLVTAMLALFMAGEGSGLRADLVAAFLPLVFVSFILLSVARHDPRNTLFVGATGFFAYVALRLFGGTAALGEPVRDSLTLLLLAASVVGGWIVSREALALATKAARAESALLREQVYQLRLFESTPEAVVLLTPASVVIRANEAFLRLFGYGQEEIAGRPIDELIIPPGYDAEAREYTASTGRGESLAVETVRCRKDGSPVDVSILGAPIFLQGEQVAIFGIYRDIGERRRRTGLFEALNRAALGMLRATTDDEAFDAAAAELAGMGLACLLLRLDPTRPALRMTHVRADVRLRDRVERALGRGLVGLELPLDHASWYGRLIAGGEPVYGADKVDIVRGAFPFAGERATAALSEILAPFPSVSVPLLREGRAFGVFVVLSGSLTPADLPAIGAFGHQLAASLAKIDLIRELERNLHELQLAQAQLLQSQKLEAVGRLAGGIAHDFNNLLTIINGYAELLTESLDPGGQSQQEASEVLRAGRRAAELTGQLLAFSRKQVLKVDLLDLNVVVEGMRKALLRLIGEDIRLEVGLEPALPGARADAGQLAQAVLNMALNARDAMPGGGTLAVRTGVATPEGPLLTGHPEAGGGRYVWIRVEDTGPGIPPGVLPHIFEPFFTTKEPGRGTGLGLAMVYGFVKQSGGYVYAENRSEGGARFSIYLPVAEGDPGGEAAVDAGVRRAAPPGGTEGILLVEDEPSVLSFARSILEHGGYGVLAAATPAEALAVAPGHLAGVSLLVTDIVMPEMNGKALADELVRRRPGLKVLFLSGYAEEVFARLGISAADVPYLQKPFGAADLLGRVRTVLDA